MSRRKARSTSKPGGAAGGVGGDDQSMISALSALFSSAEGVVRQRVDLLANVSEWLREERSKLTRPELRKLTGKLGSELGRRSSATRENLQRQ